MALFDIFRKKKTLETHASLEVYRFLSAVPGWYSSTIPGWNNMASMISGENTESKIYDDLNYPAELQFDNYYNLFKRNPLAYASVDQIVNKCYSTTPKIRETDEQELAPQEKAIHKHLKKIRFWEEFAESDRRGLVGGYAALGLWLGDGGNWNEPVRKMNGIQNLVKVFPIWRGQLWASEFDNDMSSLTYGQPITYTYSEAQVYDGTQGQEQPRTMTIHRDRLLIVSRDGTIHGESLFRAGYNTLIDIEKILAASAEGFRKNSRNSPIIKLDENIDKESIKRSLGVKTDKEMDKIMTERWQKFQSGESNVINVNGADVINPNITLPEPEHFFANAIKAYAASVNIPFRVLIGNDTGERASTEDVKMWGHICMARRNRVIEPLILELIYRFKDWGLINPSIDWMLDWESLTVANDKERLERIKAMTKANKDYYDATGEILYTSDTIRAVDNLPPLPEGSKMPKNKPDMQPGIDNSE